MSLTSSITSDIPAGIKGFFNTVYGKDPEIHSQKKSTTYSIPKEGVSIFTDPYKACHVDIKEISPERFASIKEAIQELSETSKKNNTFNSIWIDIALPFKPHVMGSILPESFEIGQPDKGDLIYDYQEKKIKIWQWLNPNKKCSIPPGATHNIGATALLIDRIAKKILLIVNNSRNTSAWNLPGGSYDPAIDKAPHKTALREAMEETGLVIEEESASQPMLVGQMEFPIDQFAPALNQVWVYSVDNLSKKTLRSSSHEIKKAEWISFDEIIKSDKKLRGLKLSKEIKPLLIAAIKNLGCKKVFAKEKMIVYAPIPENQDDNDYSHPNARKQKN